MANRSVSWKKAGNDEGLLKPAGHKPVEVLLNCLVEVTTGLKRFKSTLVVVLITKRWLAACGSFRWIRGYYPSQKKDMEERFSKRKP